jgi:hypothetical protein
MSAIHNDPRDVWERGYVPPNKPIAYSEGIDDEEAVARGEQLLRDGVPSTPSNLDMHFVNAASNERRAWADAFADFDLELFLQGVQQWQQTS